MRVQNSSFWPIVKEYKLIWYHEWFSAKIGAILNSKPFDDD